MEADFLIPVTSLGQINDKDVLVLETKESRFIVPSVKVFKKNTEQEEILIDKKNNYYFIMERYLQGYSWIKKAYILKNTKQKYVRE